MSLPVIDPNLVHLLTDDEKKQLDLLLGSVIQKQQEEKTLTFADFLCTYVKILDNEGARLMQPWQWQVELAEALPHIPLGIILKGRQIGITWLFAAYAVYVAITHHGSQTLLLSRNEDEAKVFLSRSQFIFDNLPPALKPKAAAPSLTRLYMPEIRSLIQALPSTPNAGSSRTATLVIADEFAKQEYAEQSFISLKPTAEHGGQFFLMSTAQGLGNMFAEVWLGKEGVTKEIVPTEQFDEAFSFEGKLGFCSREEKRWVRIFLPYNLRPGRDAEWWNNQYLTTPKPKRWSVYQEYPNNSLESFQQTGRPVFDLECLKTHKEQCTDPLPYENWNKYLKEIAGPPQEEWPEITCLSLYQDSLKVWEQPDPSTVYIGGADASEGLEKGDASHLVVRNGETNDEVLTLHGFWSPEIYAYLIDRIARVYPGLYGIERNNHGHAVIQKLVELGTPGLYREKPVYGRAGEVLSPGKLGWHTTAITKPLMIDELSEAVSNYAIKFRDADNFEEFMPYSTLPNGKTGALGNLHDDRVIANAIANQMLKSVKGHLGKLEQDVKVEALPKNWKNREY